MIHYAQANETMVANDQYIFQFKLPDWFTTQQLPASELQAKRSALKSAAQLAITGQRLGATFVDAYPIGDTVYAVVIQPTRAETTDAIWNALTSALTSALNPPTGFAGVTPYYQGTGGGGAPTSWSKYTPLLVGAGLVLFFVLLSGRRY